MRAKLGEIVILLSVCTLGWANIANADDWPQWQGENRDGQWTEKGIVNSFPDAGLKPKWQVDAGLGYSGPAVADGKVIVADYVLQEGNITNNPGRRDPLKGRERIRCLDAETGKPIWEHAYEYEYNLSYPGGPRATPTINGNHVVTLGAEGMLVCLSLDKGELLWSHDLKKEYDIAESPIWGFCGHPLVDGDTVYCLVGGKGSVAVAFDKESGKEKWRALDASEPGYCPPTMIEAGGTRQLIIWHAESINSLNPSDGTVYWSHPLKPAYGMSIVAPIKHGDFLFAGGIVNKSILLKLDSSRPAAEVVWEDRVVGPVHSTCLIEGDYIYVVDDKGRLHCQNLMTGERMWNSTEPVTGDRPQGSGTAFLVDHGDQCFIYNEAGELIIAELSAEGYKEIDRTKILEPSMKTSNRDVVWSHPAFANKCIYARNNNVIVCVSLSAEE